MTITLLQTTWTPKKSVLPECKWKMTNDQQMNNFKRKSSIYRRLQFKFVVNDFWHVQFA